MFLKTATGIAYYVHFIQKWNDEEGFATSLIAARFKIFLSSINHMKINNIKKVPELGAAHGRDSIFFASNGLEVEALDYSAFAVELLNKITKEKKATSKTTLL